MESVIYFRPEWTVGRYNKDKNVAIMYNLIAGYSHFFESYSADVIREILSVGRNGMVSIEKISNSTGIDKDSIKDFFEILCDNGLLTPSKPSKDDIMRYRLRTAEMKRHSSVIEKSTAEKLPMEMSTAEQSYFSALEGGGFVGSVMFELTYNCSEKCIHCYNPGATRNDSEISHRGDRAELKFEDYKRIIDQLYECGIVRVCLTGGDPFSKPFAWDIIDYLYKKEIAFDIFTNGQRIEPDIQRLANYYPHIVGISIYSGIGEDHDTITRIKGSWQRSMKVVEGLAELSVPMNLKCCVMQPNLHSYYLVADIAKKLGVRPQFEISITDSNEGDHCARQLRLTEEQLQVVLRDNNIPLYVGPETPGYGGQPRLMDVNGCGAGSTSYCITPEGYMQPCCAFPMKFGNLKEKSVREILTNNEIRSQWLKSTLNDYEECGRYDYCGYCNLCPGQGYIEHGDYKKASENCCYMAKIRHRLATKMMDGYNPLNGKEFVEALKALPRAQVKLERLFDTKG